jgi:hypothetical protein
MAAACDRHDRSAIIGLQMRRGRFRVDANRRDTGCSALICGSGDVAKKLPCKTAHDQLTADPLIHTFAHPGFIYLHSPAMTHRYISVN